jgi:hypothetical protein
MSKTVSTMNKEELRESLRAYGEEPHPRWTSVELRSRLQEIRRSFAGPKETTVNANSKKIVIEEACREQGLMVTANDTKGSLLRKLRNHQELNTPGTPDTLLAFGKHAELQYQEVRDHHPDYCRWVKEAKSDGGASAQLIRFSLWLEKMDTLKEDKPKTATARATRAKRGAGDVTEDQESTATATASQPPADVLQQLLGAVQQMSARMDHFEQTAGSRAETLFSMVTSAVPEGMDA